VRFWGPRLARTLNRPSRALGGAKFQSKNECRRAVWDMMLERKVARYPLPPHGRIPNFHGSETACQKVAELRKFRRAKALFVAPDYVLKRLRELVLVTGKRLVVPLPMMQGFLEISDVPPNKIGEAADPRGFSRFATGTASPVDVFVEGAVAVDLKGNRIGKGRGYGDREFHTLTERGLVGEGCLKVCVVHDMQVYDNLSHLVRERDVRVDTIVTPRQVIGCI